MEANLAPYIEALDQVDLSQLEMVAESLHRTVTDGGHILVAGNGGSHGIAQHFASDLMKPVGSQELCCNVKCLSNNVALVTAIGNDYGYEKIFSLQAESMLLGSLDLVLAFSVSGTSSNIQNLLKTAYRCAAKCFLIAGSNFYACRQLGTGNLLVKESHVGVLTGLASGQPLHYYTCESVFSTIAHEIARLFHIKRGNYHA